MDLFEQKEVLDSLVLLYDTREQPTKNLEKRLILSGFPYERRKLSVGDYSCECTLLDGNKLDFSDKFVIERKYDISELCMCFGQQRKRFEKEFERAKKNGTRIYLLVENANWENIFNGKYNSKFNSSALVASLLAWQTRYDMKILFCKSETAGKLIGQVLFREAKEYISRMG